LVKRPFSSHGPPQKIASCFHFFGFRDNNFFYRARSSALRPIPNLEDQVSVFMSPSDRVAQLYPQAPGYLFVAFYDSQGYGGGILIRLHTGSVRPSVCLSVCLSIYLSLYSPLDLGRFFSFLIYTQSVELLGRGSARRKAAIYTQNNANTINAHRHTCLE
jgi:hypothetical protein